MPAITHSKIIWEWVEKSQIKYDGITISSLKYITGIIYNKENTHIYLFIYSFFLDRIAIAMCWKKNAIRPKILVIYELYITIPLWMGKKILPWCFMPQSIISSVTHKSKPGKLLFLIAWSSRTKLSDSFWKIKGNNQNNAWYYFFYIYANSKIYFLLS